MSSDEQRFLDYWSERLPGAKLVIHCNRKCPCGWALPTYVSVSIEAPAGSIRWRQAEQGPILCYVFACPQCENRVLALSAPR
jgi:hypothetical protein